jgi:hypothetical protein
VVISGDQGEVLQMVDLSASVLPGNRYQLQVADPSKRAVDYQVAFSYHVPEASSEAVSTDPGQLSVDVVYDRRRLDVNDTVSAAVYRAPAGVHDLSCPLPPHAQA